MAAIWKYIPSSSSFMLKGHCVTKCKYSLIFPKHGHYFIYSTVMSEICHYYLVMYLAPVWPKVAAGPGFFAPLCLLCWLQLGLTKYSRWKNFSCSVRRNCRWFCAVTSRHSGQKTTLLTTQNRNLATPGKGQSMFCTHFADLNNHMF